VDDEGMASLWRNLRDRMLGAEDDVTGWYLDLIARLPIDDC
jgi:hypothetical protein